jgi:hypothetical protein
VETQTKEKINKIKNAVTSTTAHKSPLHCIFIQTECLPFDLMNYSSVEQIRETMAKVFEISLLFDK